MPTARLALSAVTGHDGKIYAIGGATYVNNPVVTVEAYDPASNSWSTEAPLPTRQTHFGAAAGPDGKIYAIGGDDGSNTVDTVEAYDPTSNSWSAEAPMPIARGDLAAATGHDGKIYAIGGDNNSSQGLDTVEAYDPATNSWSTKAPMPAARVFLAAATGTDGKIYAIGGVDSLASTNAVGTVEAYDPATNSWSTKAPMPTARAGLEAATGPDGKIYAIGGVDNPGSYSGQSTLNGDIVGTVEAYDPTTNSWTTKASMPTARYFLAAATGPDGKIYTIGGLDSGSASVGTIAGQGVGTSTVEAYDSTTNSWSAAPAPLTVSVKLTHGSIKAGQKQTVTVVTAPNVSVTIVVRFPNGSKKTKTAKAASPGPSSSRRARRRARTIRPKSP